MILRAAVLLAFLAVACWPAAKTTRPLEVTIKGQEAAAPSVDKPFFDVPFDLYDMARPSLAPDRSLLLAESPDVAAWSDESPVAIKSGHALEPWIDILIGRSDNLRLRIKSDDWKGPSWNGTEAFWNLRIVDENGQEFQRFEGHGAPPDVLPWNGRSNKGRWLAPGHDYSALYVLHHGDDAPFTGFGEPLRLPALTHRDEDGLAISLDSSILFGAQRDQPELARPNGEDLLRAAADAIRLRSSAAAVEVRVFGQDRTACLRQAEAVRAWLAAELFISTAKIPARVTEAPPSEARLELLAR